MKTIYAIIAIIAAISAVSADEPGIDYVTIDGIGTVVAESHVEYNDAIITIDTPITYEEYSALPNATKEEVVVGPVIAIKDTKVGIPIDVTITVRASNGKALSVYKVEGVTADTGVREDVHNNIKYATVTGKVIY